MTDRPKIGRFITLEGGEGAGKSTNIAYIKTRIENAGVPLLITREPGGTRLGEQIRKLLLDTDNVEMTSDAELLLIFAARAQHLQQIILPALDAGKWVLCDRFTDATYAYQGGGRGIDYAHIGILEEWVQHGFQPDLTLLLDLPVEVGLERAGSRGTLDRFEREQKIFFERVREAYLMQAEQQPQRFRRIDAAQPIELVQQQLDKVIDELLATDAVNRTGQTKLR